MKSFERFYQWLGLRPEEARVLWLGFAGSFLVMGFMVFSRSLREALFLAAFPAKNLPFMTLSYVVLIFPAVAAFSHFLAKGHAQSVVKRTALIGMAGLLLLWPFANSKGWMIIVFYLWTVLLCILLTTGLWLVIDEHFHLRGAKRAYGWISAGGTLGAMLVGTSLVPLAKKMPAIELFPAAIVLLALFYAVLFMFPRSEWSKSPEEVEEGKGVSIGEGLRLVKESSHLKAIAAIVLTATLASTLVDYQFKEFVQHTYRNKAMMAGFLGAFYGWGGGLALFIQIFLTSRLLGKAGIGWTLSILPLVLFFGSGAFFIVPSFYLVTGLRGMDQSLRKSTHRSAIEVLYLPVPSLIRKKTKTFIDSMFDSFAEGAGAILIFLVVTWGNISSRYLSVFVLLAAGALLYRARRMDRQYYATLVKRLREEGEELQKSGEELPAGKDLLNTSFSSVTMNPSEAQKTEQISEQISEVPTKPGKVSATPDVPPEGSSSQSTGAEGSEGELSELLQMLVQDESSMKAANALAAKGAAALPQLTESLLDENADFVMRRRIPRILAQIPSIEAEEALLRVLLSPRFEVRYRSTVALIKRRQAGFARLPQEQEKELLWQAIGFEINQAQAVWEMQTILDTLDEEEQDDFPKRQLEKRGNLSLEHVFRMLALIFDPKLIGVAYQGIAMEDGKLRSFALEYLELILPEDVREKLWIFIGDGSDYEKQAGVRPLEEVADELLKTGGILLGDAKAQRQLEVALENHEESKPDEK